MCNTQRLVARKPTLATILERKETSTATIQLPAKPIAVESQPENDSEDLISDGETSAGSSDESSPPPSPLFDLKFARSSIDLTIDSDDVETPFATLLASNDNLERALANPFPTVSPESPSVPAVAVAPNTDIISLPAPSRPPPIEYAARAAVTMAALRANLSGRTFTAASSRHQSNEEPDDFSAPIFVSLPSYRKTRPRSSSDLRASRRQAEQLDQNVGRRMLVQRCREMIDEAGEEKMARLAAEERRELEQWMDESSDEEWEERCDVDEAERPCSRAGFYDDDEEE